MLCLATTDDAGKRVWGKQAAFIEPHRLLIIEPHTLGPRNHLEQGCYHVSFAPRSGLDVGVLPPEDGAPISVHVHGTPLGAAVSHLLHGEVGLAQLQRF